MLFTPEAHEPLVNEPWSAESARTAIATIAADAERAFDDGWATHPLDVDDENDARTRFRTVYLGGAGVVDALHRLERRGWAKARWGTSDNNRRAKYYELTRRGRGRLEADISTWRKLSAVVAHVLDSA